MKNWSKFEIIDYRYLNSIDWKVFENPKSIFFASETNDFFFEISLVKEKRNFFKSEETPYVMIREKETNISIFKTSENVSNLWNNLVKELIQNKKHFYKLIEEL